MRVIADIIAYLADEGLLGAPELARLRHLGFLPRESVEARGTETDDLDWNGAAERSPSDAIDDLAFATIEGRPARRPGTGRRKPPSAAAANTGSANILVAWPGWQAELAGLTTFARSIGAPADLDQALKLIRNAHPDAIDGAVDAVLHGRAPLQAVWRAVAFQEYRGLLPSDGGGPLATACRAMLAAEDAADLGRHAAILRHEGFARLFGLIQVQRAVLAGFGRRLRAEPALFDRPLFARGFDRTAYWSLAFATTALTAADPSPACRLHRPARPWPEADDETRAWSCAAAMDRRATAALLADIAERGETPEDRVRCPVAWDSRYRPLEWFSVPTASTEPRP